MLSPFKNVKFTYLFRILDFDHDGILQESDFKSLSENLAIFRCAAPESGIDEFITKKSNDIWGAISIFLKKHSYISCNLQGWLHFMSEITENVDSKVFNILTQKAVRDIFFIYDKNHDNYLSKLEYLCFFVSLRVSIKPADFCFKTLDLNGDSKISQAELYIAIKDFFLSDETSKPGNMLFGNPEVNKFISKSGSLNL